MATAVNPCHREISIEIPSDVVARERQNVMARFQKFARIPGFRKGKVPATIVKQRFAEDIKSELVEALIPKYFRSETESQKLTPVSQPRITELQMEEGEPLRFKASFEVLPEFEVPGYQEIRVEKASVAVTDEEVEAALNQLREQQASYDNVEEDRALADGDFAQAAFEGKSDEEAAQPVKMDDVLVEIGGQNTVKEFTENLRGAKAGEERDFDVAYAEDFSEPRLAGKTLHYHVKINGIKKKTVPELNDDFAKQLGADFNTIDELRTRVKENMLHEREHEAEHKAKDQIVDELVKKYDIAVPTALLDHQIDQRLERGLRALAAQGLRAEDLKKMDMSRLREGQRDGALREVKASLLLDKIADAEKIEVSDEELSEEVQRLAHQMKQTPDALRARMEENGTLDRIKDNIRNDKALEFLYKQNQ